MKRSPASREAGRAAVAATLLALACAPHAVAAAGDAASRPPRAFTSSGRDARAIGALLASYTRAVSTQDAALFESLLLGENIPFSYVGPSNTARLARDGTRNFDGFRKGVFSGTPFAQTFSHVRISQDGPLADVTLVYTNRTSTGASWGWKTMQLIDVDGTWKIASEFFTGHAMPKS